MRLGGHEGTRGARLGTVLVVATHRHTAEGPAAARPRAQAPGPRKTWSAVDVPDEPRRRRWRWRQRPRQQSPATTRVRGGFFAPSPVLPKQGLFQDKKRRVNAAVQYQRAGGFARRSPPAGRLGPHRQPSAVGRALVAAAHRSIGGGQPRCRCGRAPSTPQRTLFPPALPKRFCMRLSVVSTRGVSTRGFRQAKSRAWAYPSLRRLGCEATAQIRRLGRPRIDWPPRVWASYGRRSGAAQLFRVDQRRRVPHVWTRGSLATTQIPRAGAATSHLPLLDTY